MIKKYLQRKNNSNNAKCVLFTRISIKQLEGFRFYVKNKTTKFIILGAYIAIVFVILN